MLHAELVERWSILWVKKGILHLSRELLNVLPVVAGAMPHAPSDHIPRRVKFFVNGELVDLELAYIPEVPETGDPGLSVHQAVAYNRKNPHQ